MTGNEGMKRGKPILMLHVYSFRASYSLGSNTVVEVHHRSQLWSPFFPCVTRIHCYAIKNKNRNHTMNKIKNIEHDRLYHLCSYSCARYLKKNILPKFIGLYMGIPYFVMQHEDVNWNWNMLCYVNEVSCQATTPWNVKFLEFFLCLMKLKPQRDR